FAPPRYGTGVRTRGAGRARRRISLAAPFVNSANEMGAHSSLSVVSALHDSERRTLSMELSLAAVFSSRPRNLRCGSAPTSAAFGRWFRCLSASADRHDSDVDLQYGRRIRRGRYLDLF